MEVDAIFSGDYGLLPPMNRTSGTYIQTTNNNVEIFNNTKYTLTVRYSGTLESKKIILLPGQRKSVSIRNGSYRVAASVSLSNVRNYAGNETLSGGDYSSEYYIVTERY